MSMNEQFSVSLCLIVRDEESSILSCLNSVKHLVQEIIVVDTGSQDRTASLAAQAGAKVFALPWSGDFAHARNYALRQAGSAWILVLDADEILEPVSCDEFQALLAAPAVEGYFIRIKNLLGSGEGATWDEAVRLFRNKPAYRFVGAIHEQVAGSIMAANRGQGLAHAPLVILHHGYLERQLTEKHKFERNTRIIQKELANNPHDPFLLYCLALEHYQQHQVAEGLACLEKALVRMEGTEGYFEPLLLHLALGLLHLGQIDKLVDFATKFLTMFPNHAALLLLRGVGYVYRQEYAKACHDFEQALADSRSLPTLAQTQGLPSDYLALTAREIAVTAAAVDQGFNLHLFPAPKMLEVLLQDLVVLVMMGGSSV